jgi:N-acetyl-gamma-glutamyl-phosphate reductase
MGYRAAVLGASGYAGGEVLRLLFGHPSLEVIAASGDRRAGMEAAEIHPHLWGIAGPTLCAAGDALSSGADVCFSCLPSGQLRDRIGDLDAGVVIDLSDDFRAPETDWIYGLTEMVRGALRSRTRIANPGCYPTAALLCLVPFARAGIIAGPIIIDALSGVSGAGRRAEDRLLFAGMTANAAAYGTTEHRHIPEIEDGLAAFAGTELTVSFTPHLVPMARGLLVTARAPLTHALSDHEALGILIETYAGEPFISVVPEWPATKSVVGSNRAHVSARVDARNELLVCSATIDNLGKGAAGQALQNANVVLGLDETEGVGALGVWP